MSTIRVLFLCTGNSARSIIAEALLAQKGEGRFEARSAGSHPAGRVHPLALRALDLRGLDSRGFYSKNWTEFAHGQAFDIVITVCDNAAAESCPVWPGQPLTAHWGIPDPAAETGSEEAQRAAFGLAFDRLERRVDALIALPVESLSPDELRRALQSIGEGTN